MHFVNNLYFNVGTFKDEEDLGHGHAPGKANHEDINSHQQRGKESAFVLFDRDLEMSSKKESGP